MPKNPNYTIMNALFIFAGAKDLDCKSNHSKLMEFYKLDKEIENQYNTKTYKELFHSLEFTLLKIRANQILKSLNLI